MLRMHLWQDLATNVKRASEDPHKAPNRDHNRKGDDPPDHELPALFPHCFLVGIQYEELHRSPDEQHYCEGKDEWNDGIIDETGAVSEQACQPGAKRAACSCLRTGNGYICGRIERLTAKA